MNNMVMDNIGHGVIDNMGFQYLPGESAMEAAARLVNEIHEGVQELHRIANLHAEQDEEEVELRCRGG